MRSLVEVQTFGSGHKVLQTVHVTLQSLFKISFLIFICRLFDDLDSFLENIITHRPIAIETCKKLTSDMGNELWDSGGGDYGSLV